MTGPFRMGWAMDYPSPQNYLEPLYSTQALPPAGRTSTFYSNPEFDALVAQGNAAAEQRGGDRALQPGRGRPARGHADHPAVLRRHPVGPLRRRRRRRRGRVRSGRHLGADPRRLTRRDDSGPTSTEVGPLAAFGVPTGTMRGWTEPRPAPSRTVGTPSPPPSPTTTSAASSATSACRPRAGCSTSAAASASGCSRPWRPHPARPASASTRPRRRSTRHAPGPTARNLPDRVTFEQADASGWSGEGFDAVLCIGATHAFGGLAETLTAVRAYLRPGGRVLLGEGFWEAPPSERALRELGAEPGELPDIAGLVAQAQEAGYEPGYAHLSTAAEWDHYEWSWTGALTEWALTEAPEADRQPALELAREHRRQYLAGYRHELGFATVVLHDVSGWGPKWCAGASFARARQSTISASASARPTHSAPSTDLPGSRSL